MNRAPTRRSRTRWTIDELFIRRRRAMMLVGVGAVVVFIVATHVVQLARGWSDLMNAAIGGLLLGSCV